MDLVGHVYENICCFLFTVVVALGKRKIFYMTYRSVRPGCRQYSLWKLTAQGFMVSLPLLARS